MPPDSKPGGFSFGVKLGAPRTYCPPAASLLRVVGQFAERQNLTMRMHMRRFIRLTNGFLKKEAHANAVALHFMYYNFVRIHKTLSVRRPWPPELLTSFGKSVILSR